MSLDADIRNLERLRHSELTLIRSKITILTESFPHEFSPACWVGKHPYVATASAAMVGFVAAQVPCKSAEPGPESPASPAPASRQGDLLALLVNAALQFLQPPQECPRASFSIADGGCTRGATFPESCFTRKC